MRQIKPELRRQDLEGIHLPSLTFAWKLTKLCRIDIFVFHFNLGIFVVLQEGQCMVNGRTRCFGKNCTIAYLSALHVPANKCNLIVQEVEGADI
jgi:hypothetical protein